MADDDDEDLSFFQRNKALVLILIVLLLGGGGYAAFKAMSGKHQTAAAREDVVISLPPLPPPPTPRPQPTPTPEQQPTPDQQQQPDQKMVEQVPTQNEKKDEAPKTKAPDAPAPLGTSITGPGGQDMGLAGGLGGGGGYGSGGNGGGGSKYGWYASEVQNRVADALRGNSRTRRAHMNVVIRIWPDASGRVTKARLAGTTGDTSLDASIQNDILTGLQLSDPPPADMPLPIVMRVSAQRPQ